MYKKVNKDTFYKYFIYEYFIYGYIFYEIKIFFIIMNFKTFTVLLKKAIKAIKEVLINHFI